MAVTPTTSVRGSYGVDLSTTSKDILHFSWNNTGENILLRKTWQLKDGDMKIIRSKLSEASAINMDKGDKQIKVV